jgi:hypothetical protein
MIATAKATSRAIVVVLFGPVVAFWAAVEGMTLLLSKGSGFYECFLRIPTVVLVVNEL